MLFMVMNQEVLLKMKNWKQSQQMIYISDRLRVKQLTAQRDLRAFGLMIFGEGYLQYLSHMVTRCVKMQMVMVSHKYVTDSTHTTKVNTTNMRFMLIMCPSDLHSLKTTK